VLVKKQLEDPPAPRALHFSPPADLANLCMALLARDPDKRPTALDVLERLTERKSPRSLSRNVREAPVFIGREGELALCRDAFSEAASDHGQVLVLYGAPGIGKTTVARHFLDSLSAE